MHGLSSAEQIGLKTVGKPGATYMPMEDSSAMPADAKWVNAPLLKSG
jgi:hypothetical protein